MNQDRLMQQQYRSFTSPSPAMLLWMVLFMISSSWSPSAPTFVCAQSSMYRFTLVKELLDRISTVGVVYKTPARSLQQCASMCAQTYCQRFAYSLENGTRYCRGYSRHSTATTVPSVAARTYMWNNEMPGVPSNVALRKPAIQSSEYSQEHQDASMAVDGNRDTDFHVKPCTHTLNNEAAGSWWQVDLQGQYVVYSVLITNRADCCSYRLRDFLIHVYSVNSTFPASNYPVFCHKFDGPMASGVTEELPCWRPIKGGFLRITNTPYEYLTLCEVQVMALPAEV